MNKFTLDQKIPVVAKVATNTNAKVQRKSFSTVVKGTILESAQPLERQKMGKF